MGQFLALAAVIGKQQAEVVDGMGKFAMNHNGDMRKEQRQVHDDSTCSIIEVNGNTAVILPGDFYEWDACSEFLSKELKAPVFSCHIHDSDLWMYVLYFEGQVVDQFNPIPDYWDDSLAAHEIEEWAGNAAAVVSYVPGLSTADIDKYLVRWDLESEDTDPAYPDDENGKDEWQLYDFLAKVGIPMELGDEGVPEGTTYFFKVKESHTELTQPSSVAAQPTPDTQPMPGPQPQHTPEKQTQQPPVNNKPADKPWWKLW